MIPLIPGRIHVKKAAGDTLVFRRKVGDVMRTCVLPNRLAYIGPHPREPHLALFKSVQDPTWYFWDIPENFTPQDDMTPETLVGGYRATRSADTLWGRREKGAG